MNYSTYSKYFLFFLFQSESEIPLKSKEKPVRNDRFVMNILTKMD